MILFGLMLNVSRAWCEVQSRGQAPIPSGEPVFACCLNDCRCLLLTQGECDAAGGFFYGGVNYCAPNPCSCPTGACCYADGHCEVQSSLTCPIGGGTYLGSGTVCQPNPCPQPTTGACCFRFGALCRVITQDQCNQARGAFQGVGSGCDPNPCRQHNNASGAGVGERRTWGRIKRTYR
ncbi:MAG: hypothetical protein U0527_16580 [Candidatus Eisenbacteria bacterium]